MDTYTPVRAMIICANGTGDYIKKEDDIITEIADVMCEQLSNYFGKEKVELEKERKLERLKECLSKYTD